MEFLHPLDLLAGAVLCAWSVYADNPGPLQFRVRVVRIHRSIYLHAGLWPLLAALVVGAGLAGR